MAQILPLSSGDFPDWLPLWNANNLGIENAAITTETWARLLDPNFPVHGLCAKDGNQLAGIMHYVLHHTTGAIEPICYMQDLYIHPDFRRRGLARALLEHLTATAKAQNWKRIYWLTEADNDPAQKLYKTLGVKLDFTLHVIPTA